MAKRTPVSPEAAAKYDADVVLAQRFDDLFAQARTAEQDLRDAQANGASLEVNVSQPAGQANIKSVKTSLPVALPSRLTTLQKACLEATFAANPLSCPEGSNVGTAKARGRSPFW